MKTYVCDACGEVIDNPHRMLMKKFYIGMDIDYGVATPLPRKRIERVHLCDDCFHALHEIATKKKDGEQNESKITGLQ